MNEQEGPLLAATNAVREHFGVPACWAALAPGRVNLIGEHTDYNDGFVLPIAIDRACACAAAGADDPVTRIISVPCGGVTEAAPIRSTLIDWRSVREQGSAFIRSLGPDDRWAAYVIGVVECFRRECERRGEPLGTSFPTFRIAVASSVPLGSGLSSSASLEVAVCTMLEEATGVVLTKLEKAKLCQRAEREYAGVPCGIMDQYASVFGEAGHALLIDCRSCTHTLVPLPPADENGAAIVVVNSNVRHELAAGEYAKRRQACQDAAGSLGLRSLREIDLSRQAEQLAGLPEEVYHAAMHVISENQRTGSVVEACERVAAGRTTWKRALPEIGQRLVQSHESLRDHYKVSCPELDALVEIAMSVRGVYGARMTGGGFGGCIVVLVRPSKVAALQNALNAEYPSRTGRACAMFVVTASSGARVQTYS